MYTDLATIHHWQWISHRQHSGIVSCKLAFQKQSICLWWVPKIECAFVMLKVHLLWALEYNQKNSTLSTMVISYNFKFFHVSSLIHSISVFYYFCKMIVVYCTCGRVKWQITAVYQDSWMVTTWCVLTYLWVATYTKLNKLSGIDVNACGNNFLCNFDGKANWVYITDTTKRAVIC